MDQAKKEIKQVKSYSLKPINISWLKKTAFERSTPENKVSDSALLDSLIDEARAREELQPPSEKKTTKPNAQARVIALAA